MARDFARAFYNSRAWKDCRLAYKKSKRNLCEICLEKGLFVPGEIVHHKIHLDPVTINDPTISLSWDNLQLVCRDCHARLHKPTKRFKVDELGRVTIN